MSFTRKKPHVYVHVWLRGNPDYETIHRICSTIEVVVRVIVPNARVAVRSEPSVEGTEEAWYLVKKIAEEESGSRGAHNIHLKNAGETLGVDFVLEVSADMNLRQAHDVSARIEKKIVASNSRISEIIIHEEYVSELIASEQSGHGTEIKWYIFHVVMRFPEIRLIRNPTIRRVGDFFHVSIRAAFKTGTSPEKISEVTSRLDSAIRNGYPAIEKVFIVTDSSSRASDTL